MANKITLPELASFCKKKGFVFQAAEIYGGLAGFFDFGPLGTQLKHNLKDTYRKEFVHKRDNIVEQDGSIITNPKVWKASGHVDNFGDLVLTTTQTKTKLRADHFIEDTLNIPGDALTADDINKLIKEHNLKYNDEDFEEVKDFNLMFNTQVGADTTKTATAYLRPETCQSIFPNFRSVADVSRAKLPFGIVQVGKAFRNEISPRDFIFRCREFEQIEMEYFFHPQTECEALSETQLQTKVQFLSAENQDNESAQMTEVTISDLLKQKRLNTHHAYWVAEFFNWLNHDIGLNTKNLRIREHTKTELSHYSTATLDIDYQYGMGFKEMLGIANRGDYDLTQHQKHSKSKLEFFDEVTSSKVLPHVIEPSLGVERFMMAVLSEGFTNDEERGNIVLKLEPKVAPFKVAILPLMGKAPLVAKAQEILAELRDEDIITDYDKSGSVGRRYARQDEIGTPYCVTIDFETLEDGELKDTVTIRDRDSTEQKRIAVSDLYITLRKLLKDKSFFSKLE